MRVHGELESLGLTSKVQVTDKLRRMNRRKADFKFAYKFLEDDL